MSNTGAEPDGTPMAASSVEENDFVTMDLKEELEFLKGIAPYYFNEDGTPMEEAFDTVEGLIDMVDTLGRNTGEKAYGKYKKGKVLLAKKAPKGSSLHEALHGVLDLFFDATERNAFLERARKEFGIGKDIPIGIVEENLVEAFRYAKTGQINKNTNFEHLLKNSFVNRTIYKAKALLGLSPAGAKELFYRVNNNYYTTSREQLKKHIETSRTIEKQDTVPMIEGTIPLDQNQAISIKSLINLGEITYTDDNGDPCAKAGLTNATKGTDWKIVKDFKGQPKHSQGGVDITISDKGVSMRRGGKDIKAKYGLLIPATIKAEEGLVVNNDNPIEYEAMSNVLSQRNKSLNWVERGLNPNNYPTIDNGDGTFSTHRLEYKTGDNGEAYVYPAIIQQEDGSLKKLTSDEAWKYAKDTNTAMRIPNVKLAEYYSKNGLIKH